MLLFCLFVLDAVEMLACIVIELIDFHVYRVALDAVIVRYSVCGM